MKCEKCFLFFFHKMALPTIFCNGGIIIQCVLQLVLYSFLNWRSLHWAGKFIYINNLVQQSRIAHHQCGFFKSAKPADHRAMFLFFNNEKEHCFCCAKMVFFLGQECQESSLKKSVGTPSSSKKRWWLSKNCWSNSFYYTTKRHSGRGASNFLKL